MRNKNNSKLQKTETGETVESHVFQNSRRYGFGVFFLLLLLLVCYISVLRINGYSAYVMEMADPQLKQA